MLVDASVILEGRRTLEVAAVIIGVMIALKWLAAWIVARVKGYTVDERGVIFGLSIGRAAAALAITLIGYDVGLFDAAILNAVVLMLLVTAVASPWATKRAGRRLALAGDVDRAAAPLRPADPAPDLPCGRPPAATARVGLAAPRTTSESGRSTPSRSFDRTGAATRIGRSTTPTTTSRDSPRSERGRSPRRPGDPGRPQSRLLRDRPRRARGPGGPAPCSAGTPSARSASGCSGSIIDQVLERTTNPVMVARLGHPVNMTDRLFVVLPDGIDHHEGFFESVALLKRLADRLGAAFTVLAVGDSAHQCGRRFDLVEPELDAEFRELSSWRAPADDPRRGGDRGRPDRGHLLATGQRRLARRTSGATVSTGDSLLRSRSSCSIRGRTHRSTTVSSCGSSSRGAGDRIAGPDHSLAFAFRVKVSRKPSNRSLTVRERSTKQRRPAPRIRGTPSRKSPSEVRPAAGETSSPSTPP